MQRRVSGALRDKQRSEVGGLAAGPCAGGLLEGVVSVDETAEPDGLDEAVDDEPSVDRRR